MREKRNVILLTAVLFLMMVLGGCRGNELDEKPENESQEQSDLESSTDMTNEATELRAVVFRNRVDEIELVDEERFKNELHSTYQVEDDADILYAFEVCESDRFDETYPEDYPVQGEEEDDESFDERRAKYCREMIVEALKKEGFVILSASPGERLVFAGTMDKLRYHFTETHNLDGWRLCVVSAIRPDMDEILAKAGWNDNTDREEWFAKHIDTILPLLGTEEKQITLEVPVIQ